MNANLKSAKINEKNESNFNEYILTYKISSLSTGVNKFMNLTNCFECASKSECYWCNISNTCDNYTSSKCNVDTSLYVRNTETSDF